MKLRNALLASAATLLGTMSIGAQAASENLLVDNSTYQTAQDVGAVSSAAAVNVFGVRGTVSIFGVAISDDDNADFYQFSVGANQMVTLTVQTPEGSLENNDPVVGLFDANGMQLANDDDGGAGYDSLLTYTLTTAGTYYAAVSGYADFDFIGGGSTNFIYDLKIEAAPAPVPVPAAAWLFGSALLGLAASRRKS
ncbi:MAG TPA: DVUA0089 family protein [Pseudomonadales bacterium]|nr:DVUA0089 family protein [Pseudomonadales bacterium]HNN66770.1 DVUA0089 family protein [Pseudomonadales bacterium]